MIKRRTFVLLTVIATAGLGIFIAAAPGRAALAVDVYLVVVGRLALLPVIGRTLGTLPREASDAAGCRPAGRAAGPGRARSSSWSARSVSRPRPPSTPLPAPSYGQGHRRLPAAVARRRPGRLPGGAAKDLLGPEAWDLARRDNPRPRATRPRHSAGEDRRRTSGARSTMTIAEVAERATALLDEVERAVVGKREALELVLLGLLADGHVLIEDFPGLAKTLIARSFAQATSLDFGRIQFTPDLMPSDVTGSSVYNQRTSEFEFRPGPVFTNLLLADEINRAPPKTQAALLEAMQEHQVTSEGLTRPLERPFIVLATQNPIEHEGTYPLPEAQLDRFLLRISVGYPSREDEIGILEHRRDRRTDEVELDQVVDAETCAGCSARSRTSTSRKPSATTSSTSSARRESAQRPGRGEPARNARDPQARPSPRSARRPRLRRPRRRQGGRRPGARPPALAPAGALGAADASGGRRRGAARDGATPPRKSMNRAPLRRRPPTRRSGAGAPRRARARRPELAALAAPFLLLLAAGFLTAGDPDLRTWVRVDRDPGARGRRRSRLEVELEAADDRARRGAARAARAGWVADCANPVAVRVSARRLEGADFRLRVERWGAHRSAS